MSIKQFPPRGAFRLETLKSTLRPVDTGTLSTPEVAALCEAALPDCTVEEIIQALREVAEEHRREAEQLEVARSIDGDSR